MNTVIITGSAGLVGSACVRKFHDEGWRVVGVDNFMREALFGGDGRNVASYDSMCNALGIIHTHRIDIRDNHNIDTLFGEYRPNAVIHCAAQPSHDWAAKSPPTDFAINAVGTLNVLEAARKYCPDAPFVFCSTNKVYGDAPNRCDFVETDTRYHAVIKYEDEYTDDIYQSDFMGFSEQLPVDHCLHSVFGASKVAADIMVQEYGRYFGMPTVCFRGGCLTGAAHAGAEQHGFLAYLMKCAREGRKYRIYGYKGKQVRDNIHAYDLADAFWAFVQRPSCGAVYNIGGGPERSVSVLEAITMAERYTSHPMDVEYVDEARKGDHKWWVTDVSKFRRDFPEWEYRWSLDQIFEEMANV